MWLRGVLIALVLLLVTGCGSSSVENSDLNLRIINGRELPDQIHQFVEVRMIAALGGISYCSGTVIGTDTVLTAAHCVEHASKGQIITNTESIEIESFVMHPGYTKDLENGILFNDVAIIKTTQEINRPALGLVLSHSPESNQQISIYGYGVDQNRMSRILRTGEMPVIGLSENHIFASYINNGSNVCYGDSGGPALFSFIDEVTNEFRIGIVGITSTGTKPDCSIGAVAFFTNLQNPATIEFILAYAPQTLLY